MCGCSYACCYVISCLCISYVLKFRSRDAMDVGEDAKYGEFGLVGFMCFLRPVLVGVCYSSCVCVSYISPVCEFVISVRCICVFVRIFVRCFIPIWVALSFMGA